MAASGMITLTVARPLGDPISITVGADSTVASLKRAVQATGLTTVTSGAMRLVFKGVSSKFYAAI